MRANWEYVKIGDICIVERGGSPRPIDDYITDRSDGINWIKIGDTTDSMFITSTAQKIIPEGAKKSRYVQPGDFLLSNSMSFGRPYILKIGGCIHDGWLVIRDSEELFDKRFLYYCLSSKPTYEKFKMMAVGGVVNNLNSEMVRKVEVPVPPITEQMEIADLLDKANSLIEKRKQQLAALDDLIKARFVEMFGDPVTFQGQKIKLTAAGKVYTGNTPSMKVPEYYNSDDIPFVKPSDIGEDGVTMIQNVAAFISEKGRTAARIMPRGTVLVTCIGTIGKVGIAMQECCCNQQINYIIPNDKYNSVYLAYCISFYKGILTEMANAPVVPIINKTQFSNIEIPLVQRELQENFASFFLQVDETKAAVQKALDETQVLFNSLMQKYFG